MPGYSGLEASYRMETALSAHILVVVLRHLTFDAMWLHILLW